MDAILGSGSILYLAKICHIRSGLDPQKYVIVQDFFLIAIATFKKVIMYDTGNHQNQH